MTDVEKQRSDPEPPKRSDPFERRPMSHSFAGFLDSIIQASTDEAEKRLSWVKRRLEQSRRGRGPRAPRR